MDAIRSLSAANGEIFIYLFFRCFLMHEGNVASKFRYAKSVVSGNLSIQLAVCTR